MTEEQLDRMIKSTKAYKLMSGARGLPEADVDAMKDCIRRIVTIALENPEIHELEINPVIVGLKGGRGHPSHLTILLNPLILQRAFRAYEPDNHDCRFVTVFSREIAVITLHF